MTRASALVLLRVSQRAPGVQSTSGGPSSSKPGDGCCRPAGPHLRRVRHETPSATRSNRSPEARTQVPEEAPGQRARVELLSGTGAVVSAHQHFLGNGGETGGDQAAPTQRAHQQLGSGSGDQAPGPYPATLGCCCGRLLDCLEAASLGVDQGHLGLLDEEQQWAGRGIHRSRAWRIAYAGHRMLLIPPGSEPPFHGPPVAVIVPWPWGSEASSPRPLFRGTTSQHPCR
jgi:hypothetical protein